MVSRRPLVLASGLLSELPPGDTVVGADVTVGTLTAGSGLSGGGNLSSNQRVDVSLAANPSGIIFVGNQLGLDGAAQRTADTALSSGNAGLSLASTALASGNAALARTLIETAVNLSGGVTGAVPYQSGVGTTAFLSPGASGQVLATQGASLAPTWITPGGGKVLQVVQNTSISSFSTNSTSYVSVGLSVSITPSSASSRILLFHQSGGTYNGVGGNQEVYLTFFRNSTNVVTSPLLDRLTNYVDSSTFFYNPSMVYLDSPATTSAITYSVRMLTRSGQTSYWNFSGNTGQGSTAIIIAVEIGP